MWDLTNQTPEKQPWGIWVNRSYKPIKQNKTNKQKQQQKYPHDIFQKKKKHGGTMGISYDN